MSAQEVPYDLGRRNALIDKWENRDLTIEEAKELMSYFERDAETVDSEEEERLMMKAMVLLRVLINRKEARERRKLLR